MNFVLFILLNYSFITLAYISSKLETSHQSSFNVNLLFGRLDQSLGITAPWGTDENPYLISEVRHLQNLYTLQNNLQSTLIDEESVFQVSDTFGKPIFIGGTSPSNLLNLSSIGSEENPFVSTFRGVVTTNSNDFITLPSTGEISDTSAIGNIRINASGTQQDIGLFGAVGPKVQPTSGTVGRISTLLITNIEINTSSVGGYHPEHTYFVTEEAYETNHIGILAGHAQYTEINDISVYYSGTNGNPIVKAFNINNVAGLTSAAKYASATGIVGYYQDIVVNDAPVPVTSDGFPNFVGGGNAGLDLGVVYAKDLWKFMEDNNLGGPTPLNEYSLRNTFGSSTSIYKNQADKSYFQIGVFTFAHSMEVHKDDSITKLWTQPGTDKWSVSTGNNYTSSTQQQPVVSYKYNLTQITSASMANQNTGASVHTLNTTLSNSNTYKYMITVPIGGKEYALVRNGATASPKEINPSNFVIPQSELEYYSFDLYNNIVTDPDVPAGRRLSGIGQVMRVESFNAGGSINSSNVRYAGYGKTITRNSVIKEIPRPLRIYNDGTGTTSFMATSVTGSYTEGIRFVPATSTSVINLSTSTSPSNTSYSTFIIQRTFRTTGNNSVLSFTVADGFAANAIPSSPSDNYTTRFNGATRVKLWAVNYANPGSPVPYNKAINTPTSNITTYDSDKTVLFYKPIPGGTLDSQKYRYEMTSLESLNWSDNQGKPLKSADKAIAMATPTSYYYMNSSFWGVKQGIPNPGGTGTINVPEGSIGFTVQPSTTATKSKIYVIVATNPAQDFNQTINVSRFGAVNSTSQTGNRTVVDSFLLPPVPGATQASTIPITIVDNNVSYSVYPNLNVLLVAYIIEVNVLSVPITYFLESSQGTASFVYLSSERTAAKDNNPDHENDVEFPPLDWVDYVFLGAGNRIATVNSGLYKASLTSTYFGVTRNPANLDGSNPNIDALIVAIATAYDFTYAINRAVVYNSSTQKNVNTLFITINILAPGSVTGNTDAILQAILDNYNFNFSEWSKIDEGTYEFTYSDAVVMNINGKLVNWLVHY